MPQTTISDLITRAEGVGLVVREPSPVDGRVVHVRLTAEGDRRLATCLGSLDDDRIELERALAAATRRMRSMGHPA